jgi:gliding motility-associated-like protein
MENKFDEIIKNAALEHEEEYRPEFWDAFEKKMNAQSKPQNNWIKYAAGAAVIVASVAAIYFLNDNKQQADLSENKTLPVNVEAEKTDKNNVANTSAVELKTENVQSANMKVEKNTEVSVSESVKPIVPVENKTIATEDKESTLAKTENKQINNNSLETAPIKPIIELKKNLVCEGEQFTVNASNIPDNVIISWDFGDGKSSNKKQATYAYSKAGNYVIELNCFVDKKLVQKESTQIIVSSNPKADFEWTDKNELEENYTISFTDQSYDAAKWEWNFGDKQIASVNNPVHTFKGQGTYAVSLTVTNLNGCKDQKTQFINVIDQNPLLAPNSFSPNGDGLNDYFMPKALENSNINFELKILDRSGNLIYQTNDSNKPWNGRVNNSGELFNNGTPFIWIVTITTPEGKIKRFNGTINIVN